MKYYLEHLNIVKQYYINRFIYVNGYGSAQKIMHNRLEDTNAFRRITIKFELNDSKIIHKLKGMIND